MKRRYMKRALRKFIFPAVSVLGLLILATKALQQTHIKLKVSENESVEKAETWPLSEPSEVIEEPGFDISQFYNINIPFRLPELKGLKRDWADNIILKLDSKRIGLGEQGKAANITNETNKDLVQSVSLENGFNALLSDMISVNRSVPIVPIEECRHRQYLANLPTTSIVIPCYNEHFSVLIRTLYSIKNRTPAELLREIIIVDDFSDRHSLKQELNDYVTMHFQGLVTIIRLPKRSGLIEARLVGARRATGDVLVFLDSHVECNYNWLPPLLEPIVINKHIVTCPIIDGISEDTFEYTWVTGSRGAFNWYFDYRQLPVLPADSKDNSMPFRSPVMMGGLFAIRREFFWELGAYDEGLHIWGAEQFELSFKIWMCGGLLIDVPCSHTAHIFRGDTTVLRSNDTYLPKNIKRVADVWMDEYKKYIYENVPEAKYIDPGNLTKQKALRKKLRCKTFKWFLDEIAPDILKAYPPELPPNYASGVIQSMAYPYFCVDTYGNDVSHKVGLYTCDSNRSHPQATQFWSLSHNRDIRLFKGDYCLDVPSAQANSSIWMWLCHNEGGNQFWSYDMKTKMIAHSVERTFCMEAFVQGFEYNVFVNPCDNLNPRMKWEFGWVDELALTQFWNATF